MSKYMPLFAVLLALLAAPGAYAIDELFDYELPIIVVKAKPDIPSDYTSCKVASFVFEGVRYYRTYLSTPEHRFSLLASANVGRGTFTNDKFEYEDKMPAIFGSQFMWLKTSTSYVLDPKDLRVIRTEMKATSQAGEVIYHYVCQEKNLNS